MSRRFVANFSVLMNSGAGGRLGGGLSDLYVQHDRAKHQFSIKLDDSSEEAVLRYSYIGNKTVDLSSTTVPSVFRGRGVGVQLAQAALNFVVEEDLKAHISCWFIRKYVTENPRPQYKERIVN